MGPNAADKCLAIIHQGAKDMKRADFAAADRLFAVAMQVAPSLPKPEAYSLFPLTVTYLSLLRLRQGKSDEARQLSHIAMTALDENVENDGAETPIRDGLFHGLMADALLELKEYRRAIPYYEYTAQLLAEANDCLAAAGMLANAGLCYCRCGLKEHAAIPLRAAVKIYRDHPGDPRLPVALLNLGIALSQSAPTEAEQVYLEAAHGYASKMQLESAAPAWVNLGVLCSKQDRNADALAWYEMALRVRERSTSTPPARIATLLNNIANCHRRSGEFGKVHELLDRASRLLKPEDHQSLAAIYGTRGLTLRDEGCDDLAVEQLQKSYAERQKMPSPNLEDLAVDLEYELAILNRLDRPEEAAATQSRLTATREAQDAVPHPSLEVNPDINTQAKDAEGAVLIELDCSSRPGTRHSTGDAIKLAEQLTAAAESYFAGTYRGRIMIPESTTLMFHGPDAEILFRALEPVLEDNPVSEGARISIRQGTQLRELGIPTRVM